MHNLLKRLELPCIRPPNGHILQIHARYRRNNTYQVKIQRLPLTAVHVDFYQVLRDEHEEEDLVEDGEGVVHAERLAAVEQGEDEAV